MSRGISSFPIVPTQRAAILIALTAPVALVIAAAFPGAWIVAPALAAALFVLILLDALVAGNLHDWHFKLPEDCEVGVPFDVTIAAQFRGKQSANAPHFALALDTKLGVEGKLEGRLHYDQERQEWRAKSPLQAGRRGTASLNRIWLQWRGPLGLGARQISQHLDADIRIFPNISPVRSSAMQHFMRDAQFGIIARRIRGEGTQFEALSEYEPGMDRRRIDWKASARHSRLYARENESERDNQIVFAFDCGKTMCEPVEGQPMIDRAVTAALTASYVALKGGDKVALFGFAQKPGMITPFTSDTRHFHRLQSSAASLDYSSKEPNFTLAMATLVAKLKRRSMIVLFTDFTDPTSAELMVESLGRLVDKHLVLFVTITDKELQDMADARPQSLEDVAKEVTLDTLNHQRAIVLQRLRQLGVDMIEAPWEQIGYRLIDSYLDIKRTGAIG